MADISSFLLSWWYAPDTKLALKFNSVGTSLQAGNLISSLNSATGLSCSMEENYHLENMITSHPVESGINISDHIIVMPKVYTITGLLSAIYTIPIVGTGIINFNQLGEAIKFLFTASEARTRFTLTTGLLYGQSVYKADSVAIKSIDIPRNNQFGRTAIKFTIVLQEIVVTDTNAPADNSSTQGSQVTNAPGVN